VKEVKRREENKVGGAGIEPDSDHVLRASGTDTGTQKVGAYVAGSHTSNVAGWSTGNVAHEATSSANELIRVNKTIRQHFTPAGAGDAGMVSGSATSALATADLFLPQSPCLRRR
jgi:hypothetical protein